MLSKLLCGASLALLSVHATAQCSTLTVTGTGQPGTTLLFSHDGAPGRAFVLLCVSRTQGTTTVGPNSLVLGLAEPILPIRVGPSNLNGDAVQTIAVPSAATQGIDLFAQTVAVDFTVTPPTGGGAPSVSVSSCASNVVPFRFGL